MQQQDMMKQAQEMMKNMDPEELKIQDMVQNMSPEQREEMLEKLERWDLFDNF